jgi:hypothetical protein
MKALLRFGLFAALLLSLLVSGFAQDKTKEKEAEKKAGVVPTAELKQLVPTSYFFAGQSAPVQLRNSVAIRMPDGHLVLAGLVDTSGYSSDVQQKYQGFFITESKLDVEGKEIGPGQYGFGFANGKFRIMDVANNDLLEAPFQQDDQLKRPVPLKAAQAEGAYRLYAGKKYVTLKAK